MRGLERKETGKRRWAWYDFPRSLHPTSECGLTLRPPGPSSQVGLSLGCTGPWSQQDTGSPFSPWHSPNLERVLDAKVPEKQGSLLTQQRKTNVRKGWWAVANTAQLFLQKEYVPTVTKTSSPSVADFRNNWYGRWVWEQCQSLHLPEQLSISVQLLCSAGTIICIIKCVQVKRLHVYLLPQKGNITCSQPSQLSASWSQAVVSWCRIKIIYKN